MTDNARILPRALVNRVDEYVESELNQAAQYDNRTLLDESGVWSLHRLAAAIYAAGWSDGESAEAERDRAARRRERARP